MKINVPYREQIVDVIVYLYIMLFVYAALTKILDFENFQIELAQSPLLTTFAGPISFAVPIIEVLIALFLSYHKTRKIALYSGFGLMVMFTVYIVIMVNFSPFVPCSCGGILEKMTWNQHLIFNIIFVIFGLIAIVISNKKNTLQVFEIKAVSSTMIVCSAIV